MYELLVTAGFAAAHCLRGYKGSCEKLHGHNWKIDVVLEAEKLDEIGMVVDFKDVKAALREVLEALDHSFLNDLPQFKQMNPTTENIARYVSESLAPRLPHGVRVKSVTSWESENCGAKYVP